MKNLKIRVKLFILVIFMLFFILFIGIASLFLMEKINNNSTVIAENWLPSVIIAEELNTLTSDYRIEEYKLILETEKGPMDSILSVIGQKQTDIENLFKEYESVITNDTDRNLMQEAKTKWNNYLEKANQIHDLAYNNKNEEATQLMKGESLELFNTASDLFLQVVNFNKTGGMESSEEGNKVYSFAFLSISIILVVIILAAIIAALYIVHIITTPVKEIDNVAKSIADGKLDAVITYQSKDELGTLAVNFNQTVNRLKSYVDYIKEISTVLNQIAEGNLIFELTYDYFGEFSKIKEALENISSSLNNTMTKINTSAKQVSIGSEQLAENAQALAQGATEQAGSIEELVAITKEVTEQIQDTADGSKKVSIEAQNVSNKTQESKVQINDMNKAMKSINDTSQKVVSIIQTIEQIATQTNLLSLNASIEAARAGEAGKGFAVVANEIGQLAEESSQAANNTRNLIELSIQEINKGNSIVENTVSTLTEVILGVVNITDMIEEIKNASLTQSDSMVQINSGIEQISSVIQSNSAAAQESSATSEELAAQAESLKELVDKFHLKS